MKAGTWPILLIDKFPAPSLVPITGRNEWQEELAMDPWESFCYIFNYISIFSSVNGENNYQP